MPSTTGQQHQPPNDHTQQDTPDRNPPDPVTGTTENATGEEQAAENEDRDPVG